MERPNLRILKNRLLTIPAIIIILALLFQTHRAQGTRYWNQNYGTRSNLLGGQVIGSVEDITAVYYNPGYLGLVEDAELIIGAKIYEYNNYNFEFGVVQNESLNSSRFGASPGFVGGSFAIDSAKTHKFFYSVLVREYSKIDFNHKLIDNNPDVTDTKMVSSDIYAIYNLRETWMGMSWAFSPIENFGIGITTFAAVRNEDQRNQITNTNLSNNDLVKIQYNATEYKYYNVRILFKVGGYWKLNEFSFGANFTVPSINLFGFGNTYLNISQTGIPDNNAIINYQENLKSFYRNSMNVAAGFSYRFNKSKIHLSLEFFNKVNLFRIMEPEPFVAQSIDSTITIEVTQELKSVLNIGLGYELYLNDSWSVYGSFFIDQNASVEKQKFEVLGLDKAIYHLTTGGNIKLGKAVITVGLEFAYSKSKFDDLFEDFDFGNQIPLGSGSITYFKIKGILSAAIQL